MSNYRDNVDTSKCYFCPRKDSIEVHHIVPRRFEGVNRKENLVAVCERCHKKLEALYDKRFYEKLGIEDEKGSRESHIECVAGECSQRADFYARSPQHTSRFYRCMQHTVEALEDYNISRERIDDYVDPVSSATVDALVSEINTQRFSELRSIGGDGE